MKKYEVAIIGAGPAGVACAIQLKRYGIDTIIFDKNNIGGLLRNAGFIENYPGFPEGITGPELVSLLKQQLDRHEIQVNLETVLNVDWTLDKNAENTFVIDTNKRTLFSDYLVVASGTRPKELSLEVPKILKDKIFYNIYPLTNLKGMKIAIIGSGDSAFDYAFNLSRKNSIVILNRSEKLKCNPALWESCSNSKNIEYLDNMEIERIDEIDRQFNLICTNKEGIHADLLVVAIGREPEYSFINNEILNQFEEDTVFLAGDVKNGHYRQTAISAGDGIKSAMKIYQRLRNVIP